MQSSYDFFNSKINDKGGNGANISNLKVVGLLILLVAQLLSMGQLFADNAGDKRIIRVGVFQTEPLIFTDENGLASGLYADLLNEIAREENWKIEYVPDTFAGGLEGLRTTDIDIMTSIVYSQERDTYADFSREIVFTVWGVVYVQPASGIEDVRSLQGKKVAVLKNGIHGINFLKLCQEFDVTCDILEMPSYEEALHAVEFGEADAAVTNSVFGALKGAEHHVDQSSIIFSPTNAFFAFPEGKNRDLATIIDSYLQNWKQDKNSVYYNSLNRWFMQNTKSVKIVPSWVYAILVGLLLIALSFMIWTRLLKKIVKIRTSALNSSKKNYHNLYDSAPDMYISLVPDSATILECNDTLLQRTGYSREEIIGSAIYKICHEDCVDKLEKVFQQYNEFGEVHEVELILRKKDGDSIEVSLNMNTVRDVSGTVIKSMLSWRDISRSKKLEKSLKNSEERFRQITENSQEWIWEIDANGLYTYSNQILEELLGYQPDEIVGKKHFYDLFLPEDREELKALGFNLISDKLPFKDFIKGMQKKDGSFLWFSTSGVPLLDKEGNLLGYRGADINITERKLVEDALIESERKMHTWLENSPVCTKIIDLDFNLQFMSKAGITALKIDKVEKFYGKPYPFSFFPDSYKISMFNKLKRAGEIGKVLSHEGQAQDLRGNILWFYATIVPVYDEASKLDYFIVVSQEITERKLAEEELKLSESALQEAQGISKIGSWEMNSITQELSWSDQMYSLLEIERNEKPSFELHFSRVHPDDLEYLKGIRSKVFVENQNTQANYRLLTPSGYVKYISAKGQHIKDNNGNITKRSGILQDITERKLAEEKISAAEENLKSTFDLSPSIIARVNLNTDCFTEASPAVTRILGYSMQELCAKPLIEFIHPDDRQRSIDEMSKVRKGEYTIFFENRYLCKDGTYTWLAWNSTKADEDGMVTIIGSDISQRKLVEDDIVEKSRELEKQLKKSEKHRVANLVILKDLNKLTCELKSEINERRQTEEMLKQRMIELEIFNDASVDRELVINDQRKEINELLKKSGLEKKYKVFE